MMALEVIVTVTKTGRDGLDGFSHDGYSHDGCSWLLFRARWIVVVSYKYL